VDFEVVEEAGHIGSCTSQIDQLAAAAHGGWHTSETKEPRMPFASLILIELAISDF